MLLSAAMTQEELSKAGRKGGKISGQKNKENNR
jgi:general stress protein YciG